MVLFPWGSSAMVFLPGEVCYMVFLQGERLSYGIISAGTISHGICSLIMKFVWGEIYHKGETLPYGIDPPGEVLPLDFFRGKVCHMVFLQGGRLPNGIISGGGVGGGRIPM